MSAAESLRAAQAAGISITLDGEGLLLEAVAEPPQSVLDALARHKRAILNLLRPGQSGWTPEQWRAYFNRHYEIAARNGGRQQSEVEASALGCCVIEWLNRNSAPSAPGRCARCGKTESCDAVVLPFGIKSGTHRRLHSNCWPAWYTHAEARQLPRWWRWESIKRGRTDDWEGDCEGSQANDGGRR
jgi:hypothetical protein